MSDLEDAKRKAAKLLGVDHMPDTITLRGRVFKFVGVNLRASKMPIIGEYEGKRFTLSKEAVKESLAGGAIAQPRRRKTYFSEVPIGGKFHLLDRLGRPLAGIHKRTGKYKYVIVSPGTPLDNWPASWDGDERIGVMLAE